MDIHTQSLDELENDIPLEGQGNELQMNTAGEKLEWDDMNTEKFVLLMADEVKKGNRTTSTFNSLGWKNLVTGMTDVTKKSCTQPQLRNKFNQLRVLYKDFKKLKEETGVGYDAVTGMVTMEPERWERLIKVIPNARKFRKKGCKHFANLSFIFGDTCATGAYAQDSTSPATLSQMGNTSASMPRDSEMIHDPVEVDFPDFSPSPTPPPSKKRKRDSFASTIEKVMATLKESSDMRTDRIEKVIAAASSSKGASCDHNVEVTSPSKKVHDEGDHVLLECMDILAEMPDIPEDQFVRASKLLHDSKNWRLTFLCWPEKKRIAWAKNIQ